MILFSVQSVVNPMNITVLTAIFVVTVFILIVLVSPLIVVKLWCKLYLFMNEAGYVRTVVLSTRIKLASPRPHCLVCTRRWPTCVHK